MVQTDTTKNEGQTTASKPVVSTTFTYISGVSKLDDRQWKVDTHHPKLVAESMGMYWSKQTQWLHEAQKWLKQPDVPTTCSSGVWKLDGSQWKDDANHPKFVEESIGMYHWEI